MQVILLNRVLVDLTQPSICWVRSPNGDSALVFCAQVDNRPYVQLLGVVCRSSERRYSVGLNGHMSSSDDTHYELVVNPPLIPMPTQQACHGYVEDHACAVFSAGPSEASGELQYLRGRAWFKFFDKSHTEAPEQLKHATPTPAEEAEEPEEPKGPWSLLD